MVTRRITRGTLFLSMAAVSLLSAVADARAAEVNASLSTQEAFLGAPVILRLEIVNATSHDEPVLPEIAGVDVQSAGAPSRSSQTTIINGRRTDRTSAVYAWRIVPRRTGEFVIPGITIQVDGTTETTTPLRFVATKSETGDLLLVEVTGQQQRIYVGQPLKLELNIWVRPYRDAEHQLTVSEADTWRMISDATNWGPFSDRLTELANHNQRPAGEELLRKDSTGAEHSYYRYQIEATIYPKRSGQIDAGDLQIVIDYPTRLATTRDPFTSMFDSDFFRSFPGRGLSSFQRKTLTVAASRPLVAQATVAPIEVLPVPTSGRPGDYRGAVGQYQIVTHAVPTRVNAGDPITLHIGIAGNGPLDLIQAPPLADLPQLTADFKVTNEPLAGVVEGDTKIFTTSIRPRRAGITQIPSIPLSYFDPASEHFVTVQSEPIRIEVAAADRLAVGAIVGSATGNGPRPEALDPKTLPLDFRNYTGADAVVFEPVRSWWPPRFLLWGPPLAFASLWGFRQRHRLAGLWRGTMQQRLLAAQRAIDNAQSSSELASAVKAYVASDLQRPAASLTRWEITTWLEKSGVQDGAQRLDDILARCEQATYARSENGQLAALKLSAVKSLAQLSAERQRMTGGERARPWDARRKLAIECLVLAAIAVAVPTAAVAMRHRAESTSLPGQPDLRVTGDAARTDAPIRLSTNQRSALLSEANDAYQLGLQASPNDAATAKEAFSTAAEKYQLLVDSGIQNSELYCNLGNAYLQSGSLGRAIANYERALVMDPSNTKAQTNLGAARREISSTIADSAAETSLRRTFDAAVARLRRMLTSTAGKGLLATTWILAWASVFTALYLPGRRWRHALILATCLLLLCLALLGFDHLGNPQHAHAIVAIRAATLRQAPGDSFAAITNERLSEGQSLTVLRHRDSWLQVQTPDGQTGWIASPQIEYVAPPQSHAK